MRKCSGMGINIEECLFNFLFVHYQLLIVNDEEGRMHEKKVAEKHVVIHIDKVGPGNRRGGIREVMRMRNINEEHCQNRDV